MAITITEENTNEKTNEERIPDLEEVIWGFELDRFDSSSPEYHLRPADVVLLREQYEASLTDPRRI